MATCTYDELMSDLAITPPPHLNAADRVPVAKAFFAQGDVYARKEALTPRKGEGVPASRINVVQGDAVRNAHILHGKGCSWYPGAYVSKVADYGLLVVPSGCHAYLTHTGEHGSIGFGEGTWRLWGQVSYEDELRRVAD